jgi:small ubiquitin-related modifier
LGFEDGSSIDLDAFENIEENEVKTIRIKYQMKERKAVTVKVLPVTLYISEIVNILLKDVTFGRLREQFCNENNLDPSKVRFIFDSNRLKDDETPASIEMENDDAIDVYLDS